MDYCTSGASNVIIYEIPQNMPLHTFAVFLLILCIFSKGFDRFRRFYLWLNLGVTEFTIANELNSQPKEVIKGLVETGSDIFRTGSTNSSFT